MELDFGINWEDSIREETWNTLLDLIEKGHVVPIIGEELLKEDMYADRTLYTELVEGLAKQCGITEEGMTFSRLVYHNNFKSKVRSSHGIYSILSEILERSSLKVPEILKKLLSIRKFTLVLTTTFDPIVENAMKELWSAESVRVLNFCNDPASNDDITDEVAESRPTVYYVFGKAQSKRESFVVTEEDLLTFSRSWLMEGYHPKRLSNVLSGKYLLILGCNYPNWLFRFFWLSMKQNIKTKNPGMLADSKADQGIIDFLNRSEAFVQKDVYRFIIELVERWEKRVKNTALPPTYVDVFISYPHEDFEYALQIKAALEEQGVTVWMDKKQLKWTEDFRSKIKGAIEKARIFLPVLSKTIMASVNLHDPNRYFRVEWSYAVETARYRTGLDFIAPVCVGGFDMHDGKACIPDFIKRNHAVPFWNEMDFKQYVGQIVEKLNK